MSQETPNEPIPEVIPGPPPDAARASSPSQDDKTMAMLCHLGGIIASIILPLVIWLIKKDQSRFVDDQGKEALNFQLTVLIGYLLSLPIVILTCGVGSVVSIAIWVVSVIFSILGAIQANNGQQYRYPINLRIIK